MKKLVFTFFSFLLMSIILQAQTLEELKAMKAEKEAIKDNIDKEIADLDEKIKKFPGWTKGIAGLVGLDFNGANNWFANDIETNTSRGFGLTINGFANGNMEKHFIKNSLLTSINTSKATNKNLNDATGIEEAEEEISARASYLELTNLTGFYVAKNIAGSAKASYVTTIFEFNEPGQLAFSLGATWKPSSDFALYVHPIGYLWTFPTNIFASTYGAEVGATYSGEIIPGVEWTSNLNAFISYRAREVAGIDRPASDISNWTWNNAFAIADLYKGIGLGINLGLRNNKQLGFAKNVSDGGGIQMIYGVGLSYAVSR